MQAIHDFFKAWGISDAEARADLIARSVSDDVHYADPRTPEPITSASALAEYVGMFSAAAPGAVAKVLHLSTTAGMQRASVAFVMADGMQKMGQYFIETNEDDKPSRMIGFVGLGEPE